MDAIRKKIKSKRTYRKRIQLLQQINIRKIKDKNKIKRERASLVAQWLRICLLMQGHGFESWSGKIPHAAEQLGP